MDPREPQPSHPDTHHRQRKNVTLVEPNPFTNTTSNTMVEPTNAQFPPFNLNKNSCSHYESSNNNNVMSNLDSNVNVSFGSSSIKKKRGRPRKYFPNGHITLGSSSVPTQDAAIISPSSTMMKNQQVEVLGVTTGTDFSAQLITVNHGEDIVAKLAACCQGGPNTEMCILSAYGLVGIASFRQSGIIVTYEGQFELVSLSGMLEICDNKSGCKRMGNFKVSLVGPDSHLLGGVVANKLIAASSVKVTVGSFTLDVKKAIPNTLKIGPSSVPSSQFAASGTPTSATLQGPSYESSADNHNCPFSQGFGSYNNSSQPIPTMAMYQKSLAGQTQ